MMLFRESLDDNKVCDEDAEEFMSVLNGFKNRIVQDPGETGMKSIAQVKANDFYRTLLSSLEMKLLQDQRFKDYIDPHN